MSKLRYLYPFMDSEDLKDLATKVINGEVKGVKLHTLYPFLRRDDLNEIVNQLIENNDGKNLTYAIPFIGSKKLTEIYEAVKSGKLTGISETRLYPFLDKDQLKDLFDQMVKEAAEAPEEDEDEEDDELDDLDEELDEK